MNEPSPGADVARVSPVLVQMWAGASPVPVQAEERGGHVPLFLLLQMWRARTSENTSLAQVWTGSAGATGPPRSCNGHFET